MLFTSWIALCGWNKFTTSLLRAIYSIHAIHFEPHARLPSFLLGSFHQALCVSLECPTMSSAVGPTHPPQLQMELRHSRISTQTWSSHGTKAFWSAFLICGVVLPLIWLPLHLCLGQQAALGPCTTAFTHRQQQGRSIACGPFATGQAMSQPCKARENSLPRLRCWSVRTRHLKLVLVCLLWFISGFRRSINDCTFLLWCFCPDLGINTPPSIAPRWGDREQQPRYVPRTIPYEKEMKKGTQLWELPH